MKRKYTPWEQLPHFGSIYTQSDPTVWDDDINSSMAPYDIPQALRAYIDMDNGWGGIEFRYLTDDEPVQKRHEGNDLIVVLGVHTNRVYAIEFRLDSSFVEKVTDTLIRVAVQVIVSNLEKPGLKINPRVTNNANRKLIERSIRNHSNFAVAA